MFSNFQSFEKVALFVGTRPSPCQIWEHLVKQSLRYDTSLTIKQWNGFEYPLLWAGRGWATIKIMAHFTKCKPHMLLWCVIAFWKWIFATQNKHVREWNICLHSKCWHIIIYEKWELFRNLGPVLALFNLG